MNERKFGVGTSPVAERRSARAASGMDFIDEQGYRANVGIVLMDEAGRVLLAGRRGRSGWQFPQGGVGPEESIEAAMYRELREEIGLSPGDVDLVGHTQGWLKYRLPPQYIRRERRPLCVGQKQRWFLLQLACEPARLRFDLTDQPEFDRARWVDYWRPVKEVIYFKRMVYVRALSELAPLAFREGTAPSPPTWWPQRWHRASRVV